MDILPAVATLGKLNLINIFIHKVFMLERVDKGTLNDHVLPTI